MATAKRKRKNVLLRRPFTSSAILCSSARGHKLSVSVSSYKMAAKPTDERPKQVRIE